LEDYVRKFSHMRFEPQGHTKNPDIRMAKSIIDYIFRWLGITFLPGYKEATLGELPKAIAAGKALAPVGESNLTELSPGDKQPGDQTGTNLAGTLKREPTGPEVAGQGLKATFTNGRTNSQAKQGYNAKLLERAGAMLEDDGGSRSDQFAGFQADAPSCDNCGSITVRNGNCYLCHNCGNSMGCS